MLIYEAVFYVSCFFLSFALVIFFFYFVCSIAVSCSLSRNEDSEEKLLIVLKILKRFTNVDASKMFSNDNTPRTSSNGVKLRCKQIQHKLI